MLWPRDCGRINMRWSARTHTHTHTKPISVWHLGENISKCQWRCLVAINLPEAITHIRPNSTRWEMRRRGSRISSRIWCFLFNHTLQRPVRKVYNEEKWTIKVIKCKTYSGWVSDECQNVIIFYLNYNASFLCGPTACNTLNTNQKNMRVPPWGELHLHQKYDTERNIGLANIFDTHYPHGTYCIPAAHYICRRCRANGRVFKTWYVTSVCAPI